MSKFGNQELTFNFYEVARSENFNKVLFKLLPSGIYEGGLLTKKEGETNTVIVAPLIAYIYARNENLGVRIETASENNEVNAVTPTYPNVVLRLTWQNSTIVQVNCISLANGAIEATDLILGKATFAGSIISGFDYSTKSVALITDLIANRNTLDSLVTLYNNHNSAMESLPVWYENNYFSSINWISTKTYNIGDIVSVVESSIPKLYYSIINDNVGNLVTDELSWKELKLGSDISTYTAPAGTIIKENDIVALKNVDLALLSDAEKTYSYLSNGETNLITSLDLASASWNKNDCTAEASEFYQDSYNFFKVTSSNISANPYISFVVGYTTTSIKAISLLIKKGTSNTFKVTLFNGTANALEISYAWDTDVLTETIGSATYEVIDEDSIVLHCKTINVVYTNTNTLRLYCDTILSDSYTYFAIPYTTDKPYITLFTDISRAARTYEFVAELPNQVTIDFTFEFKCNYDTMGTRTLFSWMNAATGYYLVMNYQEATNQIVLEWYTPTTISYLISDVFDDGTSYYNLNQRIKVILNIDATTGSMTTDSFMKLHLLDDDITLTYNSWSSGSEAHTIDSTLLIIGSTIIGTELAEAVIENFYAFVGLFTEGEILSGVVTPYFRFNPLIGVKNNYLELVLDNGSVILADNTHSWAVEGIGIALSNANTDEDVEVQRIGNFSFFSNLISGAACYMGSENTIIQNKSLISSSSYLAYLGTAVNETTIYFCPDKAVINNTSGSGEGLDNYILNGRFENNLGDWESDTGLTLTLENIDVLYGLKSLKITKEATDQSTKQVRYNFTINEAHKNRILQFKCLFKPDINYLNAYVIKIIDTTTSLTIEEKILELNQSPISEFSFLFTTTNNENYTLVIECNTSNIDSFDYIFDNFFIGEPVYNVTSDTESQPVGTMVPYAGTIDTLNENNGWLFSDYRAVSQATYVDLFSKIGYRFSKDAADVATMVTNGTFRIPDGRGKVPRGAYNAIIQSIDISTDIITLAEQVFVRNGTPIKFYTNGGTLPTIGGVAVNEATVYFVGVISGSTIKLYDTEKNAITGGATGLINFDGNVTGTVILSSCGVYEENAMQGHYHMGNGTNSVAGGQYMQMATSGGNPIPYAVLGPTTDGTNGTPRTTNETRGSDFTANWIIRWKQQATASFFKQTASLKDAGKVYIDTQKPNANGLNARGDIILSGKHIYLISNYPDLFISGNPISDLILPCDGTGDTNSPDGIHFTTFDMSMQFVRGAIYGALLSTAWDVTTADDVDLGRSDIPNGTPIYFDVSPCTGIDAETIYYLGLRTGTRYVLYDTEVNANTNNNSTGKIALSGTAVDSNYYSVGKNQLSAFQKHKHGITTNGGSGSSFTLLPFSNNIPIDSISYVGNIIDENGNGGTPRTSNETRPTNVQVFYYITAKNTPIVVYMPFESYYKKDEVLTKYTLTGNAEITIGNNNLKTVIKAEAGCSVITLVSDEADIENEICVYNESGAELQITDGTKSYYLNNHQKDRYYLNSGTIKLLKMAGEATARVLFSYSASVVTILDAYNIASVTRISAGIYEITFKTIMDSANYIITSEIKNNTTDDNYGIHITYNFTPTTEKFRVTAFVNTNSSQADLSYGYITIFGGTE